MFVGRAKKSDKPEIKITSILDLSPVTLRAFDAPMSPLRSLCRGTIAYGWHMRR